MFAASSRFTTQGAQRIAAERRARLLAHIPAPKVESAPVAAPVVCTVLKFPRRPVEQSTAVRNALHRAHALSVRPHTPSARLLIAKIAAWHQLPVAEVMSNSRRDVVIAARFDAIVAIHLNCLIQGRPISSPEIGRIMGRDHTSVLSALRRRGLRP